MVNYLEVNGTEYPVRYSLAALSRFENKTGVKVLELADASKLSTEASTSLIFYGIQDGCKTEGVEFTLTMQELAEQVTLVHAMEAFKILASYLKPKKKS